MSPLLRLVPASLALVDRAVRPLVRRGVLRIPLVGGGVILLETVGRETGESREVPLLAARVGDHVVVSTVRADSEWVRNLAEDDEPEIVLNGRRRRAAATVHGRGPAVALLSV